MISMFFFIFLQQIFSECSFKSNLIYIDDDTSLSDLKDEFRPIFIRLTSPGCPYSPQSQSQWEAAASLFPQVDFVTVNAWKNQAITSLFGTSLTTPYHGFVLANTAELLSNDDTQFGGGEVNNSPDKFVKVITDYAHIYPISPPLQKLVPMVTDSFYQNAGNPIILLYNSMCSEEIPFVNEWLKLANEVIISESDYSVIGLLDCSTFPNECQRWSSDYKVKTPRALIYSGKTGNFEILDDYSSITQDLIDDLITNAASQPVKPTPSPIPIPSPSKRKLSADDGYTVLSNKCLQDRTIDEVKSKYSSEFTPPSGDGCKNGCGQVRVDQSTCDKIDPNPEDQTNSLKVINLFRWLAGLSNDVTYNDEWNELCQRTAHTIHNIGIVPSDHVINDRYLVPGYYCGDPKYKQVALDSLLSGNTATSFESTYKLFKDEGSHNDGVLGHRRYLLHPNLKTVGIGYYPYKEEKMSGYYMQRTACNVLRIKENNNIQYIEKSVPDNLDFISWPSAGPFPIDHLPSNWHISHPSFRNVELSDLEILVTGDDGIEMTISRIVIEKYSINKDALILIMSKESLERCKALRTINVYVKNKKDKIFINFSFTLFDLKQNTEICFYNTDKNKCPSSILDSNRFGPNNYQASIFSNAANLVKVHVVEPITLTEKISISATQRFIFSGNQINGKIQIGTNTIVDFEDPTKTDFIIEWKVKSKIIGRLDTSMSAKSITIDVSDESEDILLYNIIFYTGRATLCSLTKPVFRGQNKDIFYNFGGNDLQYIVIASISDATDTFLIGEPFDSTLQYIKDDYKGTTLTALTDMKNQKSIKRTIRVIAKFDQTLPINLDSFIQGTRKKQYQFYTTLNSERNYLTFYCNPEIRKYASSITFSDFSFAFGTPLQPYSFSLYGEPDSEYSRNRCELDNITIINAAYPSSVLQSDLYFPSSSRR